MTDQKLLELAAKAAGIECWYQAGLQYFGPSRKPFRWNPLTDDGDALRLAVKLNLRVGCSYSGQCYVWFGPALLQNEFALHADCAFEREAATRRAIVRAAACLVIVTQ